MLRPSMKIRILLCAALAAFLALHLGGCSKSPEPVEAPPTAPSAAKPAGHPALPAAENGAEARVAGTIRLEGAQFDAPTGTLFVNVRVKGTKPPWLSHKYSMESVVLSKDASGAKSMPFELRANDPTPMTGTFNSNPGQITAPPDIELELYACYKATPDAGSKTLADAAAVFTAGKLDYELTLKLP